MKLSLVVFLAVVALSLFLSFYNLPYGPPLTPPSPQFPLGTYVNGKNMVNVNAVAVLNTLIFGGMVGVIEVSTALAYGFVSATSGRRRTVMVRFLDAFNSIPRLPFLFALALFYGSPEGAFLRANFFLTALIVALTGWFNYARQVSEKLYFSYSPLLTKIPGGVSLYLLIFQYFPTLKGMGVKFFLPAVIDGISTYTAMGVIAGVGDPNFPTLTTLLNASRLFTYWWLFLVPALFRAIVIVLLYVISDEVSKRYA
ncbi:MAG: peptide ABC transporter permease [Candidatus Aramenus sp.]|nr:peptide ABC transporter permease [Candidatus Aramenus sp.]